MEGASRLQDRGIRRSRGRVGRTYARGLRRSDDGSQVLLDASCLRISGAARDPCRGRDPGRARSDGLEGWTRGRLINVVRFPVRCAAALAGQACDAV